MCKPFRVSFFACHFQAVIFHPMAARFHITACCCSSAVFSKFLTNVSVTLHVCACVWWSFTEGICNKKARGAWFCSANKQRPECTCQLCHPLWFASSSRRTVVLVLQCSSHLGELYFIKKPSIPRQNRIPKVKGTLLCLSVQWSHGKELSRKENLHFSQLC